MGICFSSPNVEDKTMRIVMLGIGGSGKSTVTQQLRLLHNPKSGQRAFSQDEILNFREIIWRNMYTAFDDLLQNYESKKETDAHKLFRGFRVRDTPDSEGVDEKQELLTAAIELLQDKQFKQICMQPGAHEEIPTLHKFVEKGDEVLSMDYQPSDEDILNCKQRTLGITRARFKRKKLFWEVIDAGGQPVERRKWERILTENISAVIFVAAINEFNTIDRYVESSKKQTRLETSLDTWAGLVNTYGEDMGNWILFLNKTDIFCNKLEDEENVKIFKERYPDFKGKLSDPAEAIEFLATKFLMKIENEELRNKVVTHPTIAVNSENIRVITETVFRRIFAKRMAYLGLADLTDDV